MYCYLRIYFLQHETSIYACKVRYESLQSCEDVVLSGVIESYSLGFGWSTGFRDVECILLRQSAPEYTNLSKQNVDDENL